MKAVVVMACCRLCLVLHDSFNMEESSLSPYLLDKQQEKVKKQEFLHIEVNVPRAAVIFTSSLTLVNV